MVTRVALGIDTSSHNCAVSLVCDKTTLFTRVEEMAKGQGERLIPLISEALSAARISLSHLTVIGVGTGPGNFTGVRIAVAAARGLSLSLGIEAVGVTGFEALALEQDGEGFSLLQGPRDIIYAQPFGARGEMVQAEPKALDLPQHAVLVGHQAQEVAAFCNGQVREARYAMPEAIARIALIKQGAGAQARPAPVYLRPADAAVSSDLPPAIL